MRGWRRSRSGPGFGRGVLAVDRGVMLAWWMVWRVLRQVFLILLFEEDLDLVCRKGDGDS